MCIIGAKDLVKPLAGRLQNICRVKVRTVKAILEASKQKSTEVLYQCCYYNWRALASQLNTMLRTCILMSKVLTFIVDCP
jgi:hypothetical protein